MGQYIGARYVPRFMGTYDSTQNYEALDVVDNGLGTSYISKIPTPANTPLTDTTHWAVYGASSGAIIDLQNQINGLHNVNISKKDTRLFVFVGDSYNNNPTPTTSFVAFLVSYLGIASTQYHNIGVGGAGLDGYKTQIDNYSYADANDVTDVVITGGINDAQALITDASAIETKIDTLYTTAVTKFPNATIWAGFCGNGLYTALTGTYPGFTYDNMTLLKTIWSYRWASKPKCIYMEDLDLWLRTITDTDYYDGGSGIHPFQIGVRTLACMIGNYLKGGANNLNDLLTVSCPFAKNTLISADTWNIPNSLTLRKKGKTTNISMGYGNIEFTSGWSMSSSNPIILGNMIVDPNNRQNATSFNKDVYIPISIYYSTTSDPTTFHSAPAVLRWIAQYMSLNVFSVATTVTVKHLYIPGFDITVPTDMLA